MEENKNNDSIDQKNSGGIIKLIKEWCLPIIAAVVIAFVINRFVFFNIVVPTMSMYPTIKPQDRILVTRVHNPEKLERGDIIVFHSDELNEELIKRLIGLPNDVVEIREDGRLYINGEIQKEEYIVNKGGKKGKFIVPEGHFLFFGDNRNNSFDSRYWKNAYIPESEIMGKAQFIIKPFKRMGKMK